MTLDLSYTFTSPSLCFTRNIVWWWLPIPKLVLGNGQKSPAMTPLDMSVFEMLVSLSLALFLKCIFFGLEWLWQELDLSICVCYMLKCIGTLCKISLNQYTHKSSPAPQYVYILVFLFLYYHITYYYIQTNTLPDILYFYNWLNYKPSINYLILKPCAPYSCCGQLRY